MNPTDLRCICVYWYEHDTRRFSVGRHHEIARSHCIVAALSFTNLRLESFVGGRQKLRYKDHIRRILNKSNIPISDLEKLTTDRDT